MTLTSAHTIPAADCLAALEVSPTGLTTPEVAQRHSRHGPHRLREVRGPMLRLLMQFQNVLV
jgi:hypothetical protein